MNGLVAKPFVLDDLFSEILNWLPEPEGVDTSVKTPSPASPGHNAIDDTALREQLEAIEGMDAQEGLRNMRGDVAGYLRLLRQLDTTNAEDIRKLNAHLENREAKEAQRIAHTLKGAAGTLGIKALQAAASELEDCLRNHTGKGNDEISRLMDAVSLEQYTFHEALARITAQATLENTVEADPAVAQEMIERLDQLLEKDDAAANTLYLENEALLKSTFGTAVEQLGQKIEAFNYPAALTVIARISHNGAR